MNLKANKAFRVYNYLLEKLDTQQFYALDTVDHKKKVVVPEDFRVPITFEDLTFIASQLQLSAY